MFPQILQNKLCGVQILLGLRLLSTWRCHNEPRDQYFPMLMPHVAVIASWHVLDQTDGLVLVLSSLQKQPEQDILCGILCHPGAWALEMSPGCWAVLTGPCRDLGITYFLLVQHLQNQWFFSILTIQEIHSYLTSLETIQELKYLSMCQTHTSCQVIAQGLTPFKTEDYGYSC